MKRSDFRPLDLQGTAGGLHSPASARASVPRAELRLACDAIAANPGVRAMLGPNVEVTVARDPKTGTLMFIVVPA